MKKKRKQNYFLTLTAKGFIDFHETSNRDWSALAKKGVFTQMPIS